MPTFFPNGWVVDCFVANVGAIVILGLAVATLKTTAIRKFIYSLQLCQTFIG